MKAAPDAARNGFWTGKFSLLTKPIRATLIDLGAFTPTVAMDFYNDVTAGILSEALVPAPTVGVVGVGIWGHDDGIFPNVSGASGEQVLYTQVEATSATSPLIYWTDDFVPVIPNGQDIGIIAPDGVQGIGQVA
jgi:hypothetical protein